MTESRRKPTTGDNAVTSERWLPVVGYEDSYEVSDLGRVRSLDRLDAAGRYIKGKILSPAVQHRGHLQVGLSDGKETKKYIHRIVMEAFVGPCPDGQEVCHRDHDPTNNHVGNLMYGTQSDNKQQSAAIGIGCKAIRRSDGVEFISAVQAEQQTGVNHSHINKVCRGKRKSAGGFGWEFV